MIEPAVSASTPIRHPHIADRTTRVLTFVVVALLTLGLVVPAIVIVVASFSGTQSMTFPPREWGFLQYRNFFGSSRWMESVWTSIQLALPASVGAIVVGSLCAYVVQRTNMRVKWIVYAVCIAPLVIPGVAYGVGLYETFVRFHAVGSPITVGLLYVLLGTPYTFIVVNTALLGLPESLEQVAMTMGASRLRAVFGITGRLAFPSALGAFLLAFVILFDEAVLINFVGGSTFNTLPKAIFDSMKAGVDPRITAIATILMFGTGVLMLLSFQLRKKVR